MNEKYNWENLLKSVGVVVVGIIVVWVLFDLLVPETGYMYGGRMGYYNMTGSNGGFLYNLLVILVKVFWFVFYISLIIGAYLGVKKYLTDDKVSVNIKPIINKLNQITRDDYYCPQCKEKLSQDFKFCPSCKASLKNHCANCGKELSVNWNCCPLCGTENNKR